MNRTVKVHAAAELELASDVRTVFYPRLADRWLRDVLAEVGNNDVRDARRRQIVAAATFADVYLYEWVRDEVLRELPDRWSRLFDLFPEDDRRGVLRRWKETPRKLHDEGLMPGRLDLGGADWDRFRRLVRYRDGLVHGKASRPESAHFPGDWAPVPSMNDLAALSEEWAHTTVVALVTHLHRAAGTSPPEWLRPS